MDSYFAESNTWLDTCKQCRDTLIYMRGFSVCFASLHFVTVKDERSCSQVTPAYRICLPEAEAPW